MNPTEPTPAIPLVDAIPFDSLPNDGAKRRAIAQDVIAQLDAQRIRPAPGYFIRFTGDPIEKTGASLRAVLAKAQQCDACALGSLVLSQLNVNGDCCVEEMAQQDRTGDVNNLVPFDSPDCDLWRESRYSPFVTRYIAAPQLTLIEIAFEKGRGGFKCGSMYVEDEAQYQRAADHYGTSVTYEQALAAMAFYSRYGNADSRLRAIMASIATHPEGMFVP